MMHCLSFHKFNCCSLAFLPSDKAVLHASCKDDDGEQAGSAQGQNSQRSNRDGLQGLLIYCLTFEQHS